MDFTEWETERYRRSLLVEGFTQDEQMKLKAARVAVVGAGGLGSAVLNYLVAAGLGGITIIEDDAVSLSNLQRQVLYTVSDVGCPKAEAAAVRLSRLNPGCDLRIVTERLEASRAAELLDGHDAVVDCTDNYATRYAIDDFCALRRIPMIYGTAEQAGGQVSVFDTGCAGRYRDLYPDDPGQKTEVGVLPPVVGIVGSWQAMETIKLLCGWGDTLVGRLLTIDGRNLKVAVFEL